MTPPLACHLSAASAHPSISTGKERDTESGNDYFPKRYYSSAMGRWMSPDPIPWLGWQHPPEGSSEEEEEESHNKFEEWISDPQNFNMYAYVNNRPLSHTDPTGMAGCTAGGKTYSTCTITITYDPKTSKGTLTVTGMNKGDKSPTELLKGSVMETWGQTGCSPQPWESGIGVHDTYSPRKAIEKAGRQTGRGKNSKVSAAYWRRVRTAEALPRLTPLSLAGSFALPAHTYLMCADTAPN